MTFWSEIGLGFGDPAAYPYQENSLEYPPGYEAILSCTTNSLPSAQNDEQKIAIQLISIVKSSVKINSSQLLFSLTRP